MTTADIQKLSIGTFDPSQPFDKPFTEQEAAHIAEVLASPSAKEIAKLKHFSRPGFDGETFHYAAFRLRRVGVPIQFSRIYSGGLINLGFVEHPPASLDFIRAVQAAGIEVDSFLLSLLE